MSKCPARRLTAGAQGMDMAPLVSAGVALAGIVLAVRFLPRTSVPQATTQSRAALEPEVLPRGLPAWPST